jgi:phosphatidylserine decarboxylase
LRFDYAADPPAFAATRDGAPLVAGLTLLALAVARRHALAGGGVFALAAGCAWFFRDPPRHCPGEPGVLYAPADGVVTAVDQVEWNWFFHGRALRIVTFLSVLDVHVNRSPVAGRLLAYRRDPGGFAPAFLTRRSEGNARQLLGIEVEPEGQSPPWNRQARSSEGRIVVAQVVGVLARRIVSWRLPGDKLAAGQKLGMIRFGSRADLLMPAELATPLVTPGAVVRAGLTPLARYGTQD